MREGLREEAGEMVKRILAAVLASAEMWSRGVVEVRTLLVLCSISIWSEGNQAKVTLCVPNFGHRLFHAMDLRILIVVIWYFSFFFSCYLRRAFLAFPSSVHTT